MNDADPDIVRLRRIVKSIVYVVALALGWSLAALNHQADQAACEPVIAELQP